MQSSYHSLAEEHRKEIEKVKGSRFIASVAPVCNATEFEAFLDRVRREFHNARHHAWAYRWGFPDTAFRSSDDGEPGGSAGRPILVQLEARELFNAGVVVTRYFGGTKLGVGGLQRAYGAAALAALEQASTREIILTRRYALTYSYEWTSAVEHLLGTLGLRPEQAEYGVAVDLLLDVPIDRCETFLVGLREATNGSLEAHLVESPH